MCVCVAKPVAVELHCHATTLLNYCPLQIWTLNICNENNSKSSISIMSFTLGQLIEDDELIRLVIFITPAFMLTGI